MLFTVLCFMREEVAWEAKVKRASVRRERMRGREERREENGRNEQITGSKEGKGEEKISLETKKGGKKGSEASDGRLEREMRGMWR